MLYRSIHLRPLGRRLTLSALTSYLSLLMLMACGQSKSRPQAAAPQPAAPPQVVVPARLPAVCTPTVATLALPLADGSRILSAYVRAENFPVNGWARYRPDGQLDTVFCRNVARLPFGAQEVIEAPDGKPDPAALSAAEGPDGDVKCLLPLPDGATLVGGWFTHLGQQPSPGLGRLAPPIRQPATR